MSAEAKLREAICAVGASLFNRGLTHGSTGNISVALSDGGWLMTPTGSSLGTLDPARLSDLVAHGMVEKAGGDRVRATRAGFFVLDAVVADLAA